MIRNLQIAGQGRLKLLGPNLWMGGPYGPLWPLMGGPYGCLCKRRRCNRCGIRSQEVGHPYVHSVFLRPQPAHLVGE